MMTKTPQKVRSPTAEPGKAVHSQHELHSTLRVPSSKSCQSPQGEHIWMDSHVIPYIKGHIVP